MFNEYRDLVIQKLDEGLLIKDVFNIIDHGSGFYEYCSFYNYVRNCLGYKREKVDCEHCGNLMFAYCPTARKEKPVCIKRRRIMRTDFKDKPYKCKCYKSTVERMQNGKKVLLAKT